MSCELCNKQEGCADWQKLEKSQNAGIDLSRILLLATPCPQIKEVCIKKADPNRKVFGVDTLTFKKRR